MSKSKTVKKPRARTPLLGEGEIVWKEPPPPARKRMVFPAEALSKKKGQWAVIKTCGSKSTANSSVSYLRKRLAAEEIEGFELRASGNEVFARAIK